MKLIIKSVFATSLMLILLASNALAQNEKSVLPVKTIELIHCTRTDYGFTDHPLIDDELQKRYLDIALDAIIETSKNADGQKFYWTAEVMDHVNEWWMQASSERRQQFLEAVKSGQMDINALSYNIQPFANERQWNTMLHWIPDELWKKFEPKIGMQNDVNGFPRTAAIGLLNKGIRYLWSGINLGWGGSPFKQPYAFWWKMEFHFDQVWKEKISDSREIAKIVQTYYFPPVVMLNPGTREDKYTFQRMNEIK